MTVKRKLYSIVFGELIMFVLIIGLGVSLLMPILSLNEEHNQLTELAEDFLITRLAIVGIVTSPLQLQYEELLEAKAELGKQFVIVSQQKELSSISLNVELAMKSVLQLEKMFNARWVIFEENLLEVMDYSEKIFFSKNSTLLNLYRIKSSNQVEDFELVLEQLDSLAANIDITGGALSSAYEVIITQDSIISQEMRNKINNLILQTLGIFIALLIVIIVFAVRLASGMARSISSLSSGVSALRAGRLTADFNTSTKDDIAVLGDNLNNFTLELSQSITSIKKSSRKYIIMKDELFDAAISSKTSTDGIAGAVSSIKEGMVDLDSKIAESGVAVTTVNSRTDELKRMLEEQTAMVEQSTSSVTQMIASVNNVRNITGKKKTATDELVKTAEAGGLRLEQTISIIQEITGSVDEIRSTASIIQSVAAQTSLLAMNAAIEAAHAGAAGAGFSVVAEEIRKLAEASGVSSKRIGGVLKEVVGSIEQAALSGDDTKKAFMNINREVVDVAGALVEINTSMDELSAGGSQILDAMTSLQGYTAGVKDGGEAMNDAADSLENAFRIVERVTSGVLAQVGGIGNRIDEISSSASVVSDISERLSAEARQLEVEVDKYELSDEYFTEESATEALPEFDEGELPGV